MSPPPPPQPIVFSGSCACARLSYTSTSPPGQTTTCYCATCRKLSGHSSMTFTHVPASSLTLHDHKANSKWEGLFPADTREETLREGVKILKLSTFAARAACVDCGTPLGMRMKARMEEVGVCVGSVDDDGGLGEEVRQSLKADKAIFVKGVPGWVDVENLGIKTCERFDVGFEEEVTGGFDGETKS